ncbi:hypothetical protein ALC62_01770 [Cyphomyrmex costatus]|uniref:Uncharacterized protein n=1 Tax=Cyphomyrmex costatus TaxID=456900 RepID=A0A151IP61_9HYME|nr:hypothetical protein ALC62_01770 [Cyphomyrmex costatus]
MQNNALSGVHFRAFEEVRKWVDNNRIARKTFFASKIRKLPKIWLNVIDNDGDYFDNYICFRF